MRHPAPRLPAILRARRPPSPPLAKATAAAAGTMTGMAANNVVPLVSVSSRAA